ncbi:hypothetical protein Y032_0008g37 [Ancylostoma ceylanicum]|uniref:Uncharacterized protein n=1 Tax=Ancylostoma ceylanicum TaxID=53326 RepID=A0A016VLK1_9BILA|nr:hypothetical protein Y032_0008g37 [Ancylostoma ceylanicum]
MVIVRSYKRLGTGVVWWSGIGRISRSRTGGVQRVHRWRTIALESKNAARRVHCYDKSAPAPKVGVDGSASVIRVRRRSKWGEGGGGLAAVISVRRRSKWAKTDLSL